MLEMKAYVRFNMRTVVELFSLYLNFSKFHLGKDTSKSSE
jgi:hypothetical protein